MKRFLIVMVVFFVLPAFSAAITELNCNSICTGAFCQDNFNLPQPTSDQTAIKYSTDSSVLLNRFGNGVFCGAFTTSRCLVPNSCLQSGGGGGGGGDTPACRSVSIDVAPSTATLFQPGFVLTDFWGYNYTSDWVNRCDPPAPPGQGCGMIPSLFLTARCLDASRNPLSCPASPTWSASSGTMESDPVSSRPENAIWRSPNLATPVAISASVSGCGTSTLSFNHHVFDACRLSPPSATLDFGKNETFSGTCFDETKQPRPCYYPIMMHPLPSGALGKVSQNTYPSGIPPDLPILGNNRPPVIWIDSTVNFSAGYIDAQGYLSGGGPTFVCPAPITVGNPATTCTLVLSSNTVPVGKIVQATPSCAGSRGPAPCPDMEFWAAPAAVVSWQNFSQANVTGSFVGSATVHAVSAPRQTCLLDKTVTFFDLVTPEITTCSYVPHDASASLDLPADASNIRAYLVGGGTDDGCTKIDVNGQRVFDEGCDAGYRYASCGLHVKAHDLSIPARIPVPLKSGANTLRGQNVDSYGAFSALRIRITGTYQSNQCPGAPPNTPTPPGPFSNTLPVTPISCQADLTVTPGACTTPPRFASFSGETTRFDLLPPEGLEKVSNVVLARPEFKIQYASDVFACAQDFDGGIRSGIGFLAVDSARFHTTVARPAGGVTITLRNLPYTQMPRLFMLDEFADAPATVLQRGQDCTTNGKCSNLQFDAARRTLAFQTNGFSSYAASNSQTDVVTPTPGLTVTPAPCSGDTCLTASSSNPQTVRFILDCPLPQLGQNLTRASAFLYVNGTPFANSTMALQYELNQTYAFQTGPVLTNPATGQHNFIIDTRYGGTYRLIAASDAWNSNECRLDVFEQESTPIPELSDWAILVVFLAAGFAACRRKK